MGWKYKSGARVKVGDTVKVAKKWAAEFGSETATVVGLAGFVTVQFPNGDKVDFDMRSIALKNRN